MVVRYTMYMYMYVVSSASPGCQKYTYVYMYIQNNYVDLKVSAIVLYTSCTLLYMLTSSSCSVPHVGVSAPTCKYPRIC